MGSMINLQAVYVTDLVGVAILVSILASRGWNLPARKEESRIIATLLVVSIFNCIADIYAFACDGMAGPLYYWILMVSNTFLYRATAYCISGMSLVLSPAAKAAKSAIMIFSTP